MKRLGKIGGIGLIMVAMLITTAVNSTAITIGYPDIAFDSQTGGTGLSYTSATGVLSVNAQVNAISISSGVPFPGLTLGFVTYNTTLASVTDLGGVATRGDFTGGSLSVTNASSNVILAGNFNSFNMTGINGFNLGSGDATFTITGGDAALIAALTGPCGGSPSCGGMVNLHFNLSKNFSSTMFASNFSGATKGDIGALPEPASLMLMGSGLIGLGLWGRRRFFG